MKLTVSWCLEAFAPTLDSIQTAAVYLRARSNTDVDTIVVDNNSEMERLP